MSTSSAYIKRDIYKEIKDTQDRHDKKHKEKIKDKRIRINPQEDLSCKQCWPPEKNPGKQFLNFWKYFEEIYDGQEYSSNTIKIFDEIIKINLQKEITKFIEEFSKLSKSCRYSQKWTIENGQREKEFLELMEVSNKFMKPLEETQKLYQKHYESDWEKEEKGVKSDEIGSFHGSVYSEEGDLIMISIMLVEGNRFRIRIGDFVQFDINDVDGEITRKCKAGMTEEETKDTIKKILKQFGYENEEIQMTLNGELITDYEQEIRNGKFNYTFKISDVVRINTLQNQANDLGYDILGAYEEEGNMTITIGRKMEEWEQLFNRQFLHANQHRNNLEITEVDLSCTECNSIGTKMRNTIEFENFWKWYSERTEAMDYSIETIRLFNLISNIEDKDSKDLEQNFQELIESCRYNEKPNTTMKGLRWLIRVAFVKSDNFRKTNEETKELLEEYFNQQFGEKTERTEEIIISEQERQELKEKYINQIQEEKKRDFELSIEEFEIFEQILQELEIFKINPLTIYEDKENRTFNFSIYEDTNEEYNDKEEIADDKKIIKGAQNLFRENLDENKNKNSESEIENLETSEEDSDSSIEIPINMAATEANVLRALERALGFANGTLNNALAANNPSIIDRIAATNNRIDIVQQEVSAKVPNFYGKEDEDVEEWIEAIEALFIASGRDPGDGGNNANIARFAIGGLQGAARAWFAERKRAAAGNLVNWRDDQADQDTNLKGKIRARFQGEEIRNRNLEDLWFVKQEKNETVGEYITRFKKKVRAAGGDDRIPDAIQRTYFLMGLQPRLVKDVKLNNPANITAMFERAKLVERAESETVQAGINQLINEKGINEIMKQYSDQYKNEDDPIYKKTQQEVKSTDDLTEMFKDLRLNLLDQMRNEIKGNTRRNNYDNKSYNRRNNNGNNRYNSNVECYNCGEMGHIRPDCPNNKRRIECYECGKVGHIRPDCPDLERNNNRRNNRNGNNNENKNDNRRNNERNNGRSINLFNKNNNKEETKPLRGIYVGKRRRVESESKKENELRSQPTQEDNWWKKGQETRRKNNQCINCKNYGHFRTECPQLTEEERRKIKERNQRNKEQKNEGRKTTIISQITEGVPKFNLSKYMNEAQSGYTMAQMCVKDPQYAKDLIKLVTRKRVAINTPMETNYFENPEKEKQTLAMFCKANIDEKELNATIDSAASESAISTKLVKELGLKIDRKNKTTFSTANGKIQTEGKINRLQIFLAGEEIRADFHVIDIDEEILLLGMDWIKKNVPDMHIEDKIIDIKKANGKIVEIPVEFEENEDEIEYESEGNEEWSDGEDNYDD